MNMYLVWLAVLACFCVALIVKNIILCRRLSSYGGWVNALETETRQETARKARWKAAAKKNRLQALENLAERERQKSMADFYSGQLRIADLKFTDFQTQAATANKEAGLLLAALDQQIDGLQEKIQAQKRRINGLLSANSRARNIIKRLKSES